MNPHSNNEGARNAEAIYRKPWLSPQIPHDILDQEAEIELMITHFPERINHLQEQSESMQRQEISVWVLIVLTGLISLLSVYILCVKYAHRSALSITGITYDGRFGSAVAGRVTLPVYMLHRFQTARSLAWAKTDSDRLR